MKQLITLSFMFGFIFLVGCGSSNPPTYKVTGLVTLDGKSIEGATITFTPSGANPSQKPAVGTSKSDGKYELTTFTGNDGAMAGQYKVTVSKIEYAPGENPYGPKTTEEPAREDSKPMTQEERDEMMKNAYKGTPKKGEIKPGTPKNELPGKYNTAGFNYEVTTASGQVFDLPLTSK